MDIMGTLFIKYVRRVALFASTKSLSVDIDGTHTFELADGQSISVGMADGIHMIKVRSGHCKKLIELHLDGEHSFTVSWDWVLGGLMICDEVKGPYATAKRRYYWLIVAAFAVFSCQISVASLQYLGLYPTDMLLTTELSLLAVVICALIITFAIRSRKVVRGTDRKER